VSIVDFSIRRPVTVFVFMLAAVVFGLVAFDDLAVDLLPEITYPSLSVRTEFDGAAPAEVESLITKPVENAVGVVNNVALVTSSSRADLSEVTLEFGWDTNMDMAALDVRERLDILQLPDIAGRPVLLRYDPSLDPIMRIGVYGDDDLVRMRLIAELQVKRFLERIEGVAAVLVNGGLEEEIHVELDERRINNLGLSTNRLITRLAQENINLTGGRLQDGQTEFLVRTINEFERPSDMRHIVVDNEGGAVVRLEDIARITRGHKEREVISRINGQESVEVAIYKEGGTNTVTVSEAVKDRLAELEDQLQRVAGDLELSIITDQADYIRQSVQEVLMTAALGGTLAIFILLMFLRDIKPTLIIGISIPISVIATFFLMYVFGVSLNIMSLGGLTLGIGLLVDNSIVVLESIQRKRDEGMGVVEAAQVGAGEVGRAVIASTMTTVCVFVPIVFVEGVAGQLFGDQALTVTFSLSVSLIVALTLIPMLASRQFGGQAIEVEKVPEKVFFLRRWISTAVFYVGLVVAKTVKYIGIGVRYLIDAVLYFPIKGFNIVFGAITRAYPIALDKVLAWPVSTLAVTVTLLAGSLLLFGQLGRELVPELVQGEFYANLELPPGTHLDVSYRRISKIEDFARSMDGVETVYAVAGTSNEQGGIAGELRENIGQLTMTLAPPIDREKEDALMESLRPELERDGDMKYRFGRPSYFSFKTPIEVEIRGFNLKLLRRMADDLVARMHEIPGLADIKSSTEGGYPELQIRFNRERLATLGFNVNAAAALIRSKVLGTVATDITREDRTIDIRLRSEEKYRNSAKDLGNLSISESGSTPILLSSVAEIVETEGPAEIRRADGERVALITANLVGRDLGSASEDIEAALDSMTWPVGFDYRLGGQRKEMETSFQSMQFAILLAIFMVYLVMASQFESLLHPLVILFSVPFSLVGVMVTLWALDVTVSVVVLIGVIMLAGIVVNNAIILVDYTNRLRREGKSKLDALRQAGQVRLRPILMTTSTTVLGLFPMALGLGEGSELRSPMAWTVIGGLVVSTGLTLLMIPAVYSLLDRSR
jgi:HAE1 family hydrophobic/amphiphilic exporter-1